MANINNSLHNYIGELPRFSRALRFHSNDKFIEYMDPVNTWNYNLNIIKDQVAEEEKILQKYL